MILLKTKKQTMRQKKISEKRWLMSKTTRVVLIFGIFLFSFLYLGQMNSVSTKGYAISDLEKEINNLEQENERLQFKIAKLGSLQNIQERMGGLQMVSVDNVEYLRMPGNFMALK